MSVSKDHKNKNQITYFEKQRDALISEIAISMDSVLNNVNALNRSLEGSIAVGKEFDSVSSLWNNFYDGLAQVEQLRSQQTQPDEENVEESNQKEREQEQGAGDPNAPLDQEMRSDAPVTDEPASEGNKMDIEQEPLNEKVDLHEESQE